MSKEQKLDKIPDSLANHLHAEAEKGTRDGNTPLEAILKTQKPKRPGSTRAKVDVLDLEGFHIYNEPMALLFFRLVQLKDPLVDKILVEANFSMVDISGKPIFPRVHDSTTKL